MEGSECLLLTFLVIAIFVYMKNAHPTMHRGYPVEPCTAETCGHGGVTSARAAVANGTQVESGRIGTGTGTGTGTEAFAGASAGGIDSPFACAPSTQASLSKPLVASRETVSAKTIKAQVKKATVRLPEQDTTSTVPPRLLGGQHNLFASLMAAGACNSKATKATTVPEKPSENWFLNYG